MKMGPAEGWPNREASMHQKPAAMEPQARRSVAHSMILDICHVLAYVVGMTQIRYRKTKEGEWVAYGPAKIVVSKANGGEDCRYVERVGKPFTVDGQRMVYGYLAPQARRGDSSVTALAESLRRSSEAEDFGVYRDR